MGVGVWSDREYIQYIQHFGASIIPAVQRMGGSALVIYRVPLWDRRIHHDAKILLDSFGQSRYNSDFPNGKPGLTYPVT